MPDRPTLLADLVARIRRTIRCITREGTGALRRGVVPRRLHDESALPRVVVVDTTFARLDMGAIVLDRFARDADRVTVERVTVPGFKDLAAASRRAIDRGAAIVIACAMPGPEPIDESCAGEASLGLQVVQALTGTPILEVFVHTNEAVDDDGTLRAEKLADLCTRRCEAHADNATRMVCAPAEMTSRAGTGRRQGADDVGALMS